MSKCRLRVERFGPVTAVKITRTVLGRPVMAVYAYLLANLMVDSGFFHARRRLLSFLEERRLSQLLLTHYHEDHSGNVAEIMSRKNVPVFGHPVTVERVGQGFPLLPYQRLIWGRPKKVTIQPCPASVVSGNYTLEPIHTPGHSPDHTVYWERNEGWLFAGDLFLGTRIKYFRADESFGESLRSLRKVSRLEFRDLFCAHRPQVGDGKEKIRQKLQFFEDLLGTARELYRKGLAENDWINQADCRENRFQKWFTFGDLSARNLLLAVWQEVTAQEEVVETAGTSTN